MQEIYGLTLASMQHDMARLEHIATNLANVATPGYKRQVIAVRPFVEALQGAVAQAGEGGAPAAAALPDRRVVSDLRAGTFKVTGQALDLALGGDGFFEVQTDKGIAYTRKGDFSVDARGRLVTVEGHLVMGKGGEIRLTGRTPLVDAAGNVSEAAPDGGPAVPIGQLKVVRFERAEGLQRLGDGLVAPGLAELVPVADADVRLRQGALENANVNTTREMVDLMQTMRHFESMHRVVQGYDEMVSSAVRKLAEA